MEESTVKKLVSLDPEKYEIISITTAMGSYINYVHACINTKKLASEIKTFKLWLETEI